MTDLVGPHAALECARQRYLDISRGACRGCGSLALQEAEIEVGWGDLLEVVRLGRQAEQARAGRPRAEVIANYDMHESNIVSGMARDYNRVCDTASDCGGVDEGICGLQTQRAE